ncbi:hypothetical protein T492DRAFT_888976 [Pavlovales sp. CCMP2436]|nr:hypothetical protein T492DRAFT_888976 [Pavlovales sp. CCMP2436]
MGRALARASMATGPKKRRGARSSADRAARLRSALLLASCASTAGAALGTRASAASTFGAALGARQEAMAVRLSAADPAARWERDEHARGVALVLEDGEVWEKGCVSITLIEDSVLTKERAEAISGRTGIAGVVEGAGTA